MRHTANMGNRDLICSGHKVSNSCMSQDDLEWASKNAAVIKQDADGRWFHSLITDRDRKYRQDYWKPDTGKERSIW